MRKALSLRFCVQAGSKWERSRLKYRSQRRQQGFPGFCSGLPVFGLFAANTVAGMVNAGAEEHFSLTTSLPLFILFGLAAAGLLAYLLKKRSQANARSDRENMKELQKKLEDAESMRSNLLKRIIQAQEDERKRISRELHDETGQSLTGLLLGLERIQQAETLEKARELAGDLRAILTKTIEEIHWLTYELRPRALDDLGLEAALKRYIAGISSHTDLQIKLQVEGCSDTSVTSALQTTVYRFVQEALTNVIKHARAQIVFVELACDAEIIRATVTDDGDGFAPEEDAGDCSNRLGLFGMKERAALLGGEFRIESAPGEGTRVSLQIPKS